MKKNGIAIKIHNPSGEVLIAACDEKLLGKTFEDDELQLHVNTEFYDGFRTDEKELLVHLKNSTSANLVGEIVIKCVIKAGLISDDCIIRIQGIPHAQIYRMT